jgi:hypothetical protein
LEFRNEVKGWGLRRRDMSSLGETGSGEEAGEFRVQCGSRVTK